MRLDVYEDLRALLAPEPPLRGIGAEGFILVCQRCHFEEAVRVGHATKLYAEMNHRHWALIPSQHGIRVKGLCRCCRLPALAA